MELSEWRNVGKKGEMEAVMTLALPEVPKLESCKQRCSSACHSQGQGPGGTPSVQPEMLLSGRPPGRTGFISSPPGRERGC